MLALLDRNRQIPGGFKFMLAEVNWQSQPWSSFNTIVEGAIQVARANPYISKTHQWPTTREGWEQRIDEYNAALCQAHGWTGFIRNLPGIPSTFGGPAPKLQSPHSGLSLGGAAAGVKILAEMFGADGPIKDKTKANERALVCAVCPKNGKGDWTAYFTKPAQAVVLKTLGALKDLNLVTDIDEELHICEPCGCPIKGKVWAKLDHLLKHIPAEDKAALDPGCWILSEERKLNDIASA